MEDGAKVHVVMHHSHGYNMESEAFIGHLVHQI